MTDKKAPTAAEARLKTIEAAIEKLINKYAKLDGDYTRHICTPDAHNPGILARKK